MKKQILTAGLIIAASLLAAGCGSGGSAKPAPDSVTFAEADEDEEKDEKEDEEENASAEQYKEDCVSVDYSDLLDDSDKYQGTDISLTVSVSQIQDDGMLQVCSESGDVYLIADERESKIPRVLSGDSIVVWGPYTDLTEDETPVIEAKYIELSDTPVASAETAATTAEPLETSATPVYQTMYVVNCNEFITLRTSPNTSASELARIPLGASVSMVETAANGFYRVLYNGMDGYALASYLSDTPGSGASSSASSGAPSYTTMYVVNCKEYITLRTQPDTSAPEICKIPLGASVSYINSPISAIEAISVNGFYEISYLGNTGYALASYLSETPGSSASAAASVPSDTRMYVVNCRDYITLRTQPDTSASEICKIPFGSPVSYITSAQNGFYKVSYLGDTGYALASYLSETPDLSSSSITMYVVNCKEYITLRAKPDTGAAEFCKIPLGASVSYITSAQNGFFKVSYLDQTGYVLSSYLSY